MSADRAPFWSGKIIARAAEMYGIARDDITGPRRISRFVEPRFLAARAMRELGMSYPEIGQRFGRDHSTAIHACERADWMIEHRPHLRLTYEEIVNAGAPGTYPIEDDDEDPEDVRGLAARRERHQKIVQAYVGGLSARRVAKQFGMDDGHVKVIVRDAGVMRSLGRPGA